MTRPFVKVDGNCEFIIAGGEYRAISAAGRSVTLAIRPLTQLGEAPQWPEFFAVSRLMRPSIPRSRGRRLSCRRLVAAVEALKGLLLLAWSGAFLYNVLSRDAAA